MDREIALTPGWRRTLRLTLVAAGYFVTGWMGLHLPHGDIQITLVWLPSGIAIAALYRWGYRCWPAIPVASILINVLFGTDWTTALMVSIGNTLGPMASTFLLRRAGFHPAFDRRRDVGILVAAGAIGMLLPATGGVTALFAAGLVPADVWPQAWGNWYLGDAMGVLLGAPIFLAWGQHVCHDALPQHTERLVWWVTAAAVTLAYLVAPTPDGAKVVVLFLPLAVVVWSALRFGVRVSSVFMLVLSLLAAWGIALGHGPFRADDFYAGLRLLWGYLATLIVLGLMIAALRAECAQAMQRLRESEDRYARLFRTTPLPMAVLDLRTERFLDVNDAAVATCGYSREECLRMTARDFEPEDSPGQFSTAFAGPLPIIGRRMRYRVRDGRVLTVELSGQKIVYSGRPAILTVTRDVTDEVDLERAVLDAGDRERQRLSEDLHDGLGQDLTGLALLGSGLASSARRDGLAVADEIERLAQIARHAVATCRQIARGLSPLSEGNGGLVGALGDMTARLQDGRGPAIEFQVRGEGAAQLPRETADHLYRIAQEALTNALKHAGARHVDITLEIEPARVRLVVTDDGGKPPTRTVATDAMGLRIMHHRAAAIGAQLVAGPGEYGGWRVVCDCPRPAVSSVAAGVASLRAAGRPMAGAR